MKVKHILKPIYNKDSQILILGSIPSPKSREVGFYYGHPHNRFWKVLSDILNEEFPETNAAKSNLVLKHNIALWDVLESCEITGASDSSIKNPKPNNINKILKETKINTIFVTGKKAEKLYNKLCLNTTNMPCICLPSTSPANCAKSYQEIKEAYEIINQHLKK